MPELMKEGLIILPTTGNQGQDHSAILKDLQEMLNQTFGGSTLISGIGSWTDDNGKLHQEDVVNFIVAGKDTAINNAMLRGIGVSFGRHADQMSVYVREFSGTVEIIPIEPAEQIQAA